jgi:Plasmid encoded RepA protein
MRETARQPANPLVVENDLPALQPLSRIQGRLVRSAVEIAQEDPASALFQHSVFCQTCLPYRDPGINCRTWQRTNGSVQLRVEAGVALHPETGQWVELGLPFGPKPRLILAYLNREALLYASPEIEVDTSLTAFAKGLLGYSPNGKEIRLLKDQLARFAASLVRMGVIRDGRTMQVEAKVVSAFDLWFPKDGQQRVLWPSTVRLSLDYFESLQRHAVPLDERAIAALAHNAMALDVYCWLAQRLHRIDPGKRAFIPWTSLKDQFGWHYNAMFKFRQVFRPTLDLVYSQYRGAKLELDGRGLTLRHSPPPIKGRLGVRRA